MKVFKATKGQGSPFESVTFMSTQAVLGSGNRAHESSPLVSTVRLQIWFFSKDTGQKCLCHSVQPSEPQDWEEKRAQVQLEHTQHVFRHRESAGGLDPWLHFESTETGHICQNKRWQFCNNHGAVWNPENKEWTMKHSVSSSYPVLVRSSCHPVNRLVDSPFGSSVCGSTHRHRHVTERGAELKRRGCDEESSHSPNKKILKNILLTCQHWLPALSDLGNNEVQHANATCTWPGGFWQCSPFENVTTNTLQPFGGSLFVSAVLENVFSSAQIQPSACDLVVLSVTTQQTVLVLSRRTGWTLVTTTPGACDGLLLRGEQGSEHTHSVSFCFRELADSSCVTSESDVRDWKDWTVWALVMLADQLCEPGLVSNPTKVQISHQRAWNCPRTEQL